MDTKQRFIGQFVKGEVKRVKVPSKNSISVYGNNVSNYGIYKVNGMTYKTGTTRE